MPLLKLLSVYPTDPAWYQTWPGPGSQPPGNQKTPASQHSQKWSATWTKDSKRQDKRWVKYEGIGPVDESGMPIAPRSVSPGLGPLIGGAQGSALSFTSATSLFPNHTRSEQGFSLYGSGGHEPQNHEQAGMSELCKRFFLAGVGGQF